MPLPTTPPALRAPLVLAAALLLGACRVEVDGAPCLSPGAATECPDGQACGNDLRCSARALACATSRCAAGAMECVDLATARRCDGGADPVCGRWVAASCAARRPDCRIVADPRVLSPGSMPPYPAGAPEPPECRFGRLTDALAVAAERAPAAATVEVAGGAGAPVVFGAATGEGWPLSVPANAQVLAAPPPAGTTVIRGEPVSGSPLLAVQGAVDGLRIEGGGATGAGVALSCGAAGSPALRQVAVDGEGTLDPGGLVTTGLSSGVAVAGGCGGRLSGVDVSNVNGAALVVDVDPAAASTVEVLGGSYRASNFGIWIRGGNVHLAPDPEDAASVVVSGNALDGIVIGGHPTRDLPFKGAAVSVALDRALVAANGGTGALVAGLPPATSRLAFVGCDLRANGLDRPARYGPSGSTRSAGGVLVSIFAADLVFRGNRVWGNGGDQLAFESDGNWSIAAPSCGPETNIFSCAAGCAAGECAVGFRGTGSVQTANNVWPGTNTFEFAAQPNVVGFATYCGADATCP